MHWSVSPLQRTYAVRPDGKLREIRDRRSRLSLLPMVGLPVVPQVTALRFVSRAEPRFVPGSCFT